MPNGSYSYSELLDLNAWIRKNSDAFYWQCTTRTVQESKLFPINPYLAMSYLNAWFRYPELFRKLERTMSAEALGDRAREISSAAGVIQNGIISQFYLGGRQMLIDMGLLKPSDALDDVAYVLDFTKRLNQSYHRNHAHILPSDAGNRSQLLPERVVQVFHADGFPVRPGDRLHTAARRFMAQLSQYAFLSHAENRLGINNSGPYRVGPNEQMVVRDFLDLAEGDFPWLDGIASKITHNSYTLAVTLKDTDFHIMDDWGSFETSPSYNHDNVTSVGLYTSDFLSDGYIPVAMDDPDTLADFMENEREILEKATSDLWTLMAGWSREQLIDSGLLVYSAVPKDLFHIAGIYEHDDWMLIDDRAQAFKPLMNDEFANSLVGELVGTITLSSQRGSDYKMSKHSDAPSDMWSLIPYSVLGDDEFTNHIGPITGGSSSLPAKTSTWTTSAGRLTLDEANDRAAEFRPFVTQEKYRYLDDEWIKNHQEDPRADELYRHTQRNSRLIQDKGATLTQCEINSLRQQAQELRA